MIPITEINVGDTFANPLWINEIPRGVIFKVEKINSTERMILIQAYNGTSGHKILSPFWKKNTDRMFSESWRYA